MNIQLYHKLIENPTLLSKETIKDLEELVNNFPLVENFKILYALNLLIQDDYRYDAAITKAAIYSSDRRKLKEWVNRMEEYIETGQKKEGDDSSESDQEILLTAEAATEVVEEPREKNALKVTNFPLEENAEPIQEDVEGAKPEKETNIANTIAAGKTNTPEVKERNGDDYEDTELRNLEADKKNIRTKKELLQLVRKRLQEIENEKQQDLNQEPESEKALNAKLIDRFIENEPSISRPDKKEFYDPQNEAIESSIDEDDFFVTETLAQIHIQQGNLKKAEKIYQKLILKNPEKSSYFAAQIEKLTKK